MTARLAALALLVVPALAMAEPPKAVVDGKYQEIKKVLDTDKTDDGVRQKITAVLESFTDFDEFSKLTLKGSWDTLNPKQRTDFTARFRKLIHKSYTKRFHANQAFSVGFVGEPQVVGDKALVKTKVTSGKTTAEVSYKLLTTPAGAWRVYDIVVDEVSLVLNYRNQFSKIMKKDGFDTLLSKMQQKIEKGSSDIEEP